jgi:uncharacterized protein YbbC (DUF1343 family)
MSGRRLLLGNERLFEAEAGLLRGGRLGLITNHSGVDGRLRATADRLCQFPHGELVALFGPEHGLRGAAADGVPVTTARDPHLGVPAYSLYGQTRQPTDQMLEGIDLMLFDIQDVGVRFYTYLYTMSLSMQACARRGIPFVVLDRPNPLGGLEICGNVLDPAFASFVGLYPIPIRYGLSIGELARLFNDAFGIHAQLQVVPMQGWQRAWYWEDTGLPWVPPSPNMPTPDTAIVYPGTCFLEGTNLSEGRGTAKPFEQVGAPFVDGWRLAEHLNGVDLPGVRFRPVHFCPSASKYAGEVCQGVQLHVLERTVFQAVRTGFEILAAVRQLWPEQFAWRLPQGGIHNFDRLAGTDQIRLALEQGMSVAALLASWEEELEKFKKLRQPYLLYP